MRAVRLDPIFVGNGDRAIKNGNVDEPVRCWRDRRANQGDRARRRSAPHFSVVRHPMIAAGEDNRKAGRFQRLRTDKEV
jgi:hypothetical protein